MIEKGNYYSVYNFNRERQGAETEPKKSEYLITMPYGIGDAVYIGLCAVDQIIKERPDAIGKIDVLCNHLQAEIFTYDPRINEIIIADKTLFPTQNKRSWYKSIFVDPRSKGLLELLQRKQYSAVFPGNAAFIFLHSLHAKVLYPDPIGILRDYFELRSFRNAPASRRIREIIHQTLGSENSSSIYTEDIPLYLTQEILRKGQQAVDLIKSRLSQNGNSIFLLVAPDTSSGVTRPTTHLLSKGIGSALEQNENLIIAVLPSYSDRNATDNLRSQLSSFEDRMFVIPAEPKLSLLFTTAIIDQSDILVTGDTSTMHFGAAVKKLIDEPKNITIPPKNSTKVIVLFGGTNPGLYGYANKVEILGRGRKEQRQVRPGLLKEGYNPHETDFFSHLVPEQLTEVIVKYTS